MHIAAELALSVTEEGMVFQTPLRLLDPIYGRNVSEIAKLVDPLHPTCLCSICEPVAPLQDTAELHNLISKRQPR